MTAEYVHQMDALEYLHTLPDASVDAVITDPPYFRVKGAAWDRQWADRSAFLRWVGELAAEWRRVLVPNGSLYCFASPQMAARVEVAIEDAGFVILNSIVWEKSGGGWHEKASRDALTVFHTAGTERVVFAAPVKQSGTALTAERAYSNALGEMRTVVFAPLRDYLNKERIRAGFTPAQIDKELGTFMASRHWFTHPTQWELPTEANYEKLRALFNRNGDEDLRREYEDLRREYDYLRREYEDLRREYEDLRRPFNLGPNNPDRPSTDVWHHVNLGALKGKHVCQKPLPLLRHMIETSTRPDALILDSFAGSGSTGVAAVQLGRRFVGTELDPEWAQRAEAAIQTAADPAQPPLF